MKLAALRLHPHSLSLRQQWRSAAGEIASRDGWLVELVDSNGCSGWGECAPLPSHGTEDFAAAAAALNRWQATLPARRVAEALRELAAHDAGLAPAARGAVECALLDLLATHAGQPLYAFLGGRATKHAVRVNAVAGAAIDAAPAIARCLADGYTIIKLKLGLSAPESELAALASIAAMLPAEASLRLDANRAWDADTAARTLAGLASLPVESVEEPLAAPDPGLLRRLQDDLPYPLALDESVPAFVAPGRLRDYPVRRMVLKPGVVGGVLPALAVAQEAEAAGIECVVSTAIEGACGTLAAAHLAAALHGDRAHGLGAIEWLEGAPTLIREGRLQLPAAAGLGFHPPA